MKKLPYSLEAEREILGAMMNNKSSLLNGVARLSEDDFFDNDNKLIFSTIKNVHDRGINVDVITVTEQMSLNKTLDSLSDKELIYDLSENVISSSNIDEHIRIVQDKTTLRNLVKLADNVCNKWDKESIGDIGEYVGKVEADILSITRNRNVGEFKSSEEVLRVLKENLFNNDKNTGNLTGVTSGFKDLDNLTHGFQKGDLIILAARPSVGKTALSLNFLMNAAMKQNVTVAMFSIEMPDEQLMYRMLSATSCVDSKKIKSLDYNDREGIKIDSAITQLSKARIFIDDTSGIKIGDLVVKARKLKEKYDDLSLIVVDYLQYVRDPEAAKRGGRTLEVGEISRKLKQLARELNIPVVALAQLSRNSEQREDKRPIMSDLRESGNIEQDADLILFIYREDYFTHNNKDKGKEKEEKNDGDSGLVELEIAKHRNGARDTVKLVFLKQYGLFSNYTKIEE